MFTDVVGYTSLTQKDESSTLQALERHRSLLRPLFASHGGREIKTIGDAFLIEFPSALDAVLCAVAIQQMMHDRKVARGELLSLRIGIHVGDVVESGNDILGDAVNIASRIEPLAEPGGVCISGEVYNQVKNKSDVSFVSLEPKSLKNVTEPIQVYKTVMPWTKPTPSKEVVTFPRDRIAILPFRNMSPDPNDEYFAEGITEEIISTVSGISGLSVISRTSVMKYKGGGKDISEIGRELRVGSVLEGSFRKAGNKIRVTTQLIDVGDDRHIWAQNYDRNLDDVFEVQSDVAKQVADALRVRILSPEKERIERKPTESTTAYALYLKGRYYWNKRILENVKTALEYIELAVHEDPGFALGYAGISDCCLILRDWGVEPEANLERAKAMANKALEFDPELAEAHASRGLLLLNEYDFAQAEEEFKKAIELKPSYASAHQWYSNLLRYQMRLNEAREQIEKAVELDPLSPVIHINHGMYYMSRKDYGSAIEPCRKAVELEYPPAHGFLATAYGRLKRFDDMKREDAALVELIKDSVPFVKQQVDMVEAYLMDDKEKVRRLLPELEAQFHDDRRWPEAYVIGTLYLYLGGNDKGFEWLERSYSRKESALLDMKSDGDFDGVRADSRYLDLLKRLGLG